MWDWQMFCWKKFWRISLLNFHSKNFQKSRKISITKLLQLSSNLHQCTRFCLANIRKTLHWYEFIEIAFGYLNEFFFKDESARKFLRTFLWKIYFFELNKFKKFKTFFKIIFWSNKIILTGSFRVARSTQVPSLLKQWKASKEKSFKITATNTLKNRQSYSYRISTWRENNVNFILRCS